MPAVELQTLKERLRAKRKEAGLTQGQLAARAGVEPSTIYRWEKGSHPSTENLTKVAMVLGVTVQWLVHGEGSEGLAGVMPAWKPMTGEYPTMRGSEAWAAFQARYDRLPDLDDWHMDFLKHVALRGRPRDWHEIARLADQILEIM